MAPVRLRDRGSHRCAEERLVDLAALMDDDVFQRAFADVDLGRDANFARLLVEFEDPQFEARAAELFDRFRRVRRRAGRGRRGGRCIRELAKNASREGQSHAGKENG